MTSQSQRTTGILLLISAALCWSLGGVLIKWVQWNPMAIAGMRSFIAAIVVFAAFPRMRMTITATTLWGAVAYAGVMITFVAATKLTTAANAILLQYTAPAWVALFGTWFLKERTKRSDWLIIILVMAGMALFFLDELTLAGRWGNIIALISGFFFAWVILVTRKQRDGSSVLSVVLGNILAGLIGLPFMFGTAPDAKGWVGLLILGVIQMGMAYVFLVKGLRYVPALEASLILLIEPVLNPVWVLLTLGERPGLLSVLGGVVILGSVTLRALLPYFKEKKNGRGDTATR
jgi:drug/metabolite transporter (DMT)-like permease